MTDLVIFKNQEGKLEGFGDKSRRAYKKFKRVVDELQPGETMAFSYRLPRSPQHHKFFFARMAALAARQESFEDLEHLLVFAKVGAGFVEFMPGPDGRLVAVPKSIAWTSLDESEFAEVNRRIWDFLWTDAAQIALWPHLGRDQRYAMIDQWVREAG